MISLLRAEALFCQLGPVPTHQPKRVLSRGFRLSGHRLGVHPTPQRANCHRAPVVVLAGDLVGSFNDGQTLCESFGFSSCGVALAVNVPKPREQADKRQSQQDGFPHAA